ncbi:DoxX-like family protein [Paenibacillus alkaliterrae]|uniref:DoxX-like family protein n=1 Tax=Paenibacillus alkaliterrae TaxID=320909 RepID=UPI001F40BB4D|nr:DoxX-like family protein [Paenibacillus alkaliterrae]MCF2938236.1 DoxX-like family protein [Paenibacillus alkaliterrae]
MLLWCYEGLVPKLLFPEAGELSILSSLGWFEGKEQIMVQLLGLAEIGFGLLTAYWHRKKWTIRHLPMASRCKRQLVKDRTNRRSSN